LQQLLTRRGAASAAALEELGAELVMIFNTHHHMDHVGGNRELIEHFPNVYVCGSAQDRGRIPGQQVFLQEGDQVEFTDRIGEVIFVPDTPVDTLPTTSVHE
jgi:hydroxyacylglutathione hydrolase